MTMQTWLSISAIGLVVGTSIFAPPSMLRGGQNMHCQEQKTLKIFMVPKFTGAAYFAATEKGAKEAVAELKGKGKGVAIDFLYTGPVAANSDEQVRMIDDLLAQHPDVIIIAPANPE